MKRTVFIVCCIFMIGIFNRMDAQAEGIRFEDKKSWKEVVEKAHKAGKLIFVDCYTSWCGPCKMLAEKVFVDRKVGDWFNVHFVNMKCEMEKDSLGSVLQERYQVKSYPTLLFLDPMTGEEVHRVVGFIKVEDLLIEAKKACDPENGLGALTKRYVAGDRDSLFLAEYIVALKKTRQRDVLFDVVPKYLELLTDEQLITSRSWDLINSFVVDPLSPAFRFLVSHYKYYYQVANPYLVESKLSSVINNTIANLAKQANDSTMDGLRIDDLIVYLLSIDHVVASSALARLYALRAVCKKDYAGLLQVMHEAFKYNVFREVEGAVFFSKNIRYLLACSNIDILKEAVTWIEERYEQEQNEFQKQNLSKLREEFVILIGLK